MEMHSFCLLHRKMTLLWERDILEACMYGARVQRGHVQWLHNIMKMKSVSVNAIMNMKEEEEDGMVNVALSCSNEG
jgi:hypothetical protein